MRKVGIKVLKNKLSEYVRLAAEGETIAITDRNEVIAQLSPPTAKDRNAMTPEEHWADMIARGEVRPATRPKPPLPPREPIMTLEQLMKELDEDREDRF
jgi:antitoxin (DNA-binding transcriptional repressor) of toxin-antitoxin stability system